jgi:cell division protease FtsH
MPDQQDKHRGPEPRNLLIPYVVTTVLVLLFYLFFYQSVPSEPTYEIPYSEFKHYLQQNRISEVTLEGDKVRGQFFDPMPIGPQEQTGKRFVTRVPAFGDDSLLPALEQQSVTVTVKRPAGDGGVSNVFIALLPWIIFFLIFLWIVRRAGKKIGGGIGGPGELKRFLETQHKEANIPEVTFTDVAGQENAKKEVAELVDYLKNPQKYLALGAEIPRGVLLMGPPGTGKTLMARALAGEAGVPFYSISGSEFIEVFVGVGASRVRHLFEDAKKNAPAIIFIDELDSVGRTRGTGLGGGHDEREQTLNQILAEMDGFAGHEAVIVLAATNRPDVLDSALLRPGRFDRHVALDMPDRNDRLAILKVHAKKLPLDDDVDLDKVTADTPGFSGTDLKNLVNESAILAARESQKTVKMQHLDAARDKVLMGME